MTVLRVLGWLVLVSLLFVVSHAKAPVYLYEVSFIGYYNGSTFVNSSRMEVLETDSTIYEIVLNLTVIPYYNFTTPNTSGLSVAYLIGGDADNGGPSSGAPWNDPSPFQQYQILNPYPNLRISFSGASYTQATRNISFQARNDGIMTGNRYASIILLDPVGCVITKPSRFEVFIIDVEQYPNASFVNSTLYFNVTVSPSPVAVEIVLSKNPVVTAIVPPKVITNVTWPNSTAVLGRDYELFPTAAVFTPGLNNQTTLLAQGLSDGFFDVPKNLLLQIPPACLNAFASNNASNTTITFYNQNPAPVAQFLSRGRVVYDNVTQVNVTVMLRGSTRLNTQVWFTFNLGPKWVWNITDEDEQYNKIFNMPSYPGSSTKMSFRLVNFTAGTDQLSTITFNITQDGPYYNTDQVLIITLLNDTRTYPFFDADDGGIMVVSPNYTVIPVYNTLNALNQYFVTIRSIHPPPVISFMQCSKIVGEGTYASSLQEEDNGFLTVSAYLSGQTAVPSMASFVLNGTAMLGRDYKVQAPTNPYLYFPNSTNWQTTGLITGSDYVDIVFDIWDDHIYEGDELIDIVMIDPINANLGDMTTFIVNITEDDPPPLVGFEYIVTPEFPESNRTLNVTLAVSYTNFKNWPGDPADYTSYQWALNTTVFFNLSGTAIEGVDYLVFPSNHSININYTWNQVDPETGATLPGTIVYANITFQILKDNIYEPTEFIYITLYDPANAIIDPNRAAAYLTILDTDQPPGASFTTHTATYDSSSDTRTFNVQVKLIGGSARMAAVPFFLADSYIDCALYEISTASPLRFDPANGIDSQSITISVTNVSTLVHEHLTLALYDPNFATLGQYSTYRVWLNRPLPTVYFRSMVTNITEGGNFTVFVNVIGFTDQEVIAYFTYNISSTFFSYNQSSIINTTNTVHVETQNPLIIPPPYPVQNIGQTTGQNIDQSVGMIIGNVSYDGIYSGPYKLVIELGTDENLVNGQPGDPMVTTVIINDLDSMPQASWGEPTMNITTTEVYGASLHFNQTLYGSGQFPFLIGTNVQMNMSLTGRTYYNTTVQFEAITEGLTVVPWPYPDFNVTFLANDDTLPWSQGPYEQVQNVSLFVDQNNLRWGGNNITLGILQKDDWKYAIGEYQYLYINLTDPNLEPPRVMFAQAYLMIRSDVGTLNATIVKSGLTSQNASVEVVVNSDPPLSVTLRGTNIIQFEPDETVKNFTFTMPKDIALKTIWFSFNPGSAIGCQIYQPSTYNVTVISVYFPTVDILDAQPFVIASNVSDFYPFTLRATYPPNWPLPINVYYNATITTANGISGPEYVPIVITGVWQLQSYKTRVAIPLPPIWTDLTIEISDQGEYIVGTGNVPNWPGRVQAVAIPEWNAPRIWLGGACGVGMPGAVEMMVALTNGATPSGATPSLNPNSSNNSLTVSGGLTCLIWGYVSNCMSGVVPLCQGVSIPDFVIGDSVPTWTADLKIATPRRSGFSVAQNQTWNLKFSAGLPFSVTTFNFTTNQNFQAVQFFLQEPSVPWVILASDLVNDEPTNFTFTVAKWPSPNPTLAPQQVVNEQVSQGEIEAGMQIPNTGGNKRIAAKNKPEPSTPHVPAVQKHPAIASVHEVSAITPVHEAKHEVSAITPVHEVKHLSASSTVEHVPSHSVAAEPSHVQTSERVALSANHPAHAPNMVQSDTQQLPEPAAGDEALKKILEAIQNLNQHATTKQEIHEKLAPAAGSVRWSDSERPVSPKKSTSVSRKGNKRIQTQSKSTVFPNYSPRSHAARDPYYVTRTQHQYEDYEYQRPRRSAYSPLEPYDFHPRPEYRAESRYAEPPPRWERREDEWY